MGGVHASMLASLYPHPLACVPLLAPRSAAVAYCKGALWDATAWKPLASATDARQQVRREWDSGQPLPAPAGGLPALGSSPSLLPALLHPAVSAAQTAIWQGCIGRALGGGPSTDGMAVRCKCAGRMCWPR